MVLEFKQFLIKLIFISIKTQFLEIKVHLFRQVSELEAQL